MNSFNSLYRLNNFIANGFKSKIYSCINNIDGQEYICKIVTGDYVYKSRADETNSMLCNHPNINKVHSVFYNTDGTIIKYIVSDMGDGDLFQYIEQQNFNLSEKTAKNFIKQMSLAIDYLHQNNICHKDIKLENFIYVKSQSLENDYYNNVQLKLIDFEFSENYVKTKMTGRKGTMSYIAPEIYNMEKYTNKIDIWSLGICSYMLLMNKNPFNHYRKCRSKVNFDIDFNSSDFDNMSELSIDFLQKLLEKNPVKRYNSKEVLSHRWLADC